MLMFFTFITCFSTVRPIKSAMAVDSPQTDKDPVTKVLCNVIGFVQKIGLPIMTGVIIGSSVMAIFGRLAWPVIVVLVVFRAIFFGVAPSSKVMEAFIGDAVKETKKCEELKGTKT